ncbi:MAG TPA: hypothetical protein VHE33_04025, partial [Acidobacteriaceae bacterium]|nr:hypothetical protein [Acidobacteriaceae bacterium]
MKAVSRSGGGGRSCANGLRGIFVFAWVLGILVAGTPAGGSSALPTLRTVREAHTLRFEEARRGYPVHLARAQVTFYQAEVPLLFLQDSTDGIFVHMRGQPPASLRCGDIVAV